MEPKPKERIVFDEDLYYGDEGEKMAIDDLMERDGLTEDEVREDFTDDEIFNHQMEMKDFDYEEEMRALAAFFNGEKSDMSDFVNPYGGNHILVSGSVGRWNGTSTGIAVYKDFDAATDCSPSRFGQGNVFADCEIQKVWDENGTLYLAGAHHDGRVSVEMRQLTDEGERLWGQLDYEDYLPLEGLTAMGKHYELGDENRFVHDLYNSPELCAAPRYVEQSLGYPWNGMVGADLDGLEAYGFAYPLSTQAATDWLEGDDLAKVNAFLKETCKEAFGILPGADDGGYSLSGEAKEAALSRFALPENRKAALNVIRKLNESRDSNDNAL